MKIIVKVTKEILEKSKMCKTDGAPTNCAIALAVRDIFPNAAVIHSYFYPDENRPLQVDLPPMASAFITEFDLHTPKNRVKMRPISFEVDIPDSVIEQIGIDEAKSIISKSETLELVYPLN